MSATRTLLCSADALPVGQARGFDPFHAGHDTIFLVRCSEAVVGYLDACPHHGGTPMAWRKDAYLNHAGDRIVCSAHGAQFAIDTGVCTLGPCLGQSLSAVRIEREGDDFYLAAGACASQPHLEPPT